MEQAISSQSGQLDVRERGDKFRKKFLERLHILKETPYAFGELTVRSLLDTREQFLASFSFCDPYLQVLLMLKFYKMDADLDLSGF